VEEWLLRCVDAGISRAISTVTAHCSLDLVYFRSTLGLAGSQVSKEDFLKFNLEFRKVLLVEVNIGKSSVLEERNLRLQSTIWKVDEGGTEGSLLLERL